MSKENISEEQFLRIADQQRTQSCKIKNRNERIGIFRSLIPSLIEEITPKKEQYSGLNDLWWSIVPEELAVHTKVLRINGSMLIIQVDSPSWLYKLQTSGTELVERLNKKAAGKKIRKIKYELER